jgi:hypothetical protein
VARVAAGAAGEVSAAASCDAHVHSTASRQTARTRHVRSAAEIIRVTAFRMRGDVPIFRGSLGNRRPARNIPHATGSLQPSNAAVVCLPIMPQVNCGCIGRAVRPVAATRSSFLTQLGALKPSDTIGFVIR